MTADANVAGRALAAAHEGSLSGGQLLEILSGQDVWVPLPGGTGEPGNGSAALQVMLIDGGKYVPVYTSAEEFSRGAGDVRPVFHLPGRSRGADQSAMARN